MRAAAIFVHGTSITGKIWNSSVRTAIRGIFDCEELDDHIERFDWCGSNNTNARLEASAELILHLKNLNSAQDTPFQKFILVGHSHGGTILLKAISGLTKALDGVELTVVTLNTPRVIGGDNLVDESVHHYHVYCPKDLIVPRAGFNKTGIQIAGGETKTIWGTPRGGEFSRPRDLGSGKHGSTFLTFETAISNIAYKDQYRLKGINPKTHITSHRGWLPKNVEVWGKSLKEAVQKYSE